MRRRDRLRSALTRAFDGPQLPAVRTDAATPTPTPTPIQTLARRFDSVLNTLSSIGNTNDKATTSRPDTARTPLSWIELEALYRHNGYARRLVDIFPDHATTKAWRINDGGDDTDPLKAEDRRLYIALQVAAADRWARLYGSALIMMVTEEDLPPEFRSTDEEEQRRLNREWLQTPLDLDRVIEIKNLVVLDRREFEPWVYDGDPTSTRFREPKIYQVTPRVHGVARPMPQFKLHASRALFFRGASLPGRLQTSNNQLDDSILESAWDAIRGKTTTDQAGEILAHEVRLDVLKIEGLSALQTGDQATALSTRMKAIAQQKSLINMILVGDGESFETHASPVTGWAELDTKQQERMAGVTGFPMTKLFGQAPGGLNTDGGAQSDTFNQLVGAYQRAKYDKPLTWYYTVVYSQKNGPTGGKVPEEWAIVYQPLHEPTAKEQAELEKLIVDADTIRITDGIVTPEHIAESRHGEKGFQTELLPVDLLEMERQREEDKAAAAAAVEAQLEATRAAAEGGEPDPAKPPPPAAPQGNGNNPPPEARDDAHEEVEDEEQEEEEATT